MKSSTTEGRRHRQNRAVSVEDKAAAKARKACGQLSEEELKELEQQALATIYGRGEPRKARRS